MTPLVVSIVLIYFKSKFTNLILAGAFFVLGLVSVPSIVYSQSSEGRLDIEEIIKDILKINKDAFIVIKSTMSVGSTKYLQKKFKTKKGLSHDSPFHSVFKKELFSFFLVFYFFEVKIRNLICWITSII